MIPPVHPLFAMGVLLKVTAGFTLNPAVVMSDLNSLTASDRTLLGSGSGLGIRGKGLRVKD